MQLTSIGVLFALFFIACGNDNITLNKNSPVYKEMSFSEFYGIQTSPKYMAELEGKIIELKGYFNSTSTFENKSDNTDLGKYKINIGPGFNATGFSVECYFNEKIEMNDLKEHRVKGQVIQRGMLKLKNCVVVE